MDGLASVSNPEHPLSPMLHKLKLWRALDAEDAAAVLALPYSARSLAAGDYIVREDDVPTSSCLLSGGFACRHKRVGGSARAILAVHMKGDIVDLQNSLLGYADHSVQVLTRAEVAFIPRGAIVELADRRPRVGLAMWYDTLVDGSISREWTANNSRRDAPARLAHLLCEFGLRLEAAGLGDRHSYDLPMTQDQLADAVGLTPIHINRTLKKLAAEGLITRSIRALGIVDFARLAEAADFDDAYLHLKQPPPARLPDQTAPARAAANRAIE